MFNSKVWMQLLRSHIVLLHAYCPYIKLVVLILLFHNHLVLKISHDPIVMSAIVREDKKLDELTCK